MKTLPGKCFLKISSVCFVPIALTWVLFEEIIRLDRIQPERYRLKELLGFHRHWSHLDSFIHLIPEITKHHYAYQHWHGLTTLSSFALWSDRNKELYWSDSHFLRFFKMFQNYLEPRRSWFVGTRVLMLFFSIFGDATSQIFRLSFQEIVL